MHLALIALFGALLAYVVWLIVLYNSGVNLKSALVELDMEKEAVRTEIADLKDSYFKMFSGDSLEEFASHHNLTEDTNPEYFEVSKQWELASDY